MSMFKVTRTRTAIYGRIPPYDREVGSFKTIDEALREVSDREDADTFSNEDNTKWTDQSGNVIFERDNSKVQIIDYGDYFYRVEDES